MGLQSPAGHRKIRETQSVDVGTILASGWTSGLSLYATALMLGVAGRLDWIDAPQQLTEPIVLGALAVLTIVEFVIDKIAWLDSIWDSIHLFIRPLGAAAMSGVLAGQTDSPVALVALIGGSFALSAHGAKSATRLLANTSPEPVSNVVLSAGEDGIVVAMIGLALAYPVVAGVLSAILAIACIVATWLLMRLVKKSRAALRNRRAMRASRVRP